MKQHFLSGVALVALVAASPAIATSPAIAANAVPLVDPWVGPYVGVNIGYSWGNWDASSNQSVFNFEQTTASPKVNGVIGGLQAGYNWRLAPRWIWGIEGDIQISGEKAHQDWSDPNVDAEGAVG